MCECCHELPPLPPDAGGGHVVSGCVSFAILWAGPSPNRPAQSQSRVDHGGSEGVLYGGIF